MGWRVGGWRFTQADDKWMVGRQEAGRRPAEKQAARQEASKRGGLILESSTSSQTACTGSPASLSCCTHVPVMNHARARPPSLPPCTMQARYQQPRRPLISQHAPGLPAANNGIEAVTHKRCTLVDSHHSICGLRQTPHSQVPTMPRKPPPLLLQLLLFMLLLKLPLPALLLPPWMAPYCLLLLLFLLLCPLVGLLLRPVPRCPEDQRLP